MYSHVSRVIAFAILVCAVGAGCGEGTGTGPEVTGLALSVDIVAGTDVAGFRFDIYTCDTTGPMLDGGVITTDIGGVGGTLDIGLGGGQLIASATTDLEDMPFPAGPEPFADGSTHLFSDQFFLLEPGCYDVVGTPVRIDGGDSLDCAPASRNGVIVEPGLTTEVGLISQCSGPEPGGLDVIGALNNPPEIVDARYDPSKFVFDCERTLVCVDYRDPNGDPLEFEWTELGTSGVAIVDGVEVADDGATACFEFAFEGIGDYQFGLTIYDLFEFAGSRIRAEDYFAAVGDPRESRAELAFDFHVNTDAEFLCRDGSALQTIPGLRAPERVDGCDFVTPEEYWCELVSDDRHCPDGDLDVEAYDLCDELCAEQNPCGGCAPMVGEPGDPCGPCGNDEFFCQAPDVLACSGATTNPCGGCVDLGGDPGDVCGPCGLDELVCDGSNDLDCNGNTEVGDSTCSPPPSENDLDLGSAPALSGSLTALDIVGLVSGSEQVLAYRVVRYDGENYEIEESDDQYLLLTGVVEHLNRNDTQSPPLRRGRGVFMPDFDSWYFVNFVVVDDQGPIDPDDPDYFDPSDPEIGTEPTIPVYDESIDDFGDGEELDILVFLDDEFIPRPSERRGEVIIESNVDGSIPDPDVLEQMRVLAVALERNEVRLEIIDRFDYLKVCGIVTEDQFEPIYSIAALSMRVTPPVARCIADSGGFARVEFDHETFSAFDPYVPSNRPNGGLARAQRMNVSEFWDAGIWGGQPNDAVRVRGTLGVMDSAIHVDHSAFEIPGTNDSRVFSAVDCRNSAETAFQGSGCRLCQLSAEGVCGPRTPETATDVDGDGFNELGGGHGTGVTHIAVGNGENWGSESVFPPTDGRMRDRLIGDQHGIAPEASVLFTSIGHTASRAEWGRSMDRFVSVGVDAVNYSFGGRCEDGLFADQRIPLGLRLSGVIGVFSAGNSGDGSRRCTVGAPATRPESFTIGRFALDNNTLAGTSAHGRGGRNMPTMVDLVAPGVGTHIPVHFAFTPPGPLPQTIPFDLLYGTDGVPCPNGACVRDPLLDGETFRPVRYQGTSFAAPAVAGLVLLIQETLRRIGSPDWDDPNLMTTELLSMGERGPIVQGTQDFNQFSRFQGAGDVVAVPWYLPGAPDGVNPPFMMVSDIRHVNRGENSRQRLMLDSANDRLFPLPIELEQFRSVFWQWETSTKFRRTNAPSVRMRVRHVTDDPNFDTTLCGGGEYIESVPDRNDWKGRVQVDGDTSGGACVQLEFVTTGRMSSSGGARLVANTRFFSGTEGGAVFPVFNGSEDVQTITTFNNRTLQPGEVVRIPAQGSTQRITWSTAGAPGAFDTFVVPNYSLTVDPLAAWPDFQVRWPGRDSVELQGEGFLADDRWLVLHGRARRLDRFGLQGMFVPYRGPDAAPGTAQLRVLNLMAQDFDEPYSLIQVQPTPSLFARYGIWSALLPTQVGPLLVNLELHTLNGVQVLINGFQLVLGDGTVTNVFVHPDAARNPQFFIEVAPSAP